MSIPCNLITVDDNGNMSAITVTSSSLEPVGTSNILFVDTSGNIGIMSPSDVVLTIPLTKYVNLLTVDNDNNFSVIGSYLFNRCNGSQNGIPQSDGSCICKLPYGGPPSCTAIPRKPAPPPTSAAPVRPF